MKVILVNGEKNKNGATNLALEEIAKELNKENIETEIFWLGNEPIRGCIGCGKCRKTNNRCFDNDVVNQFLGKAETADGFVFGSPVHFASASGAITSFLDRAFYAGGKYLTGKVCSCVASCRRGGASATFDQLNKYPLINNMYVVGSSYWNQIHGNNREEATQDLEGLQTMRNIGKNMAYILKCMEKANLPKPVYDDTIRTNFIR